jgi:hypothetical protein
MNASSKANSPESSTVDRVNANAVPPAYKLALFHAEPSTKQGTLLTSKEVVVVCQS